MPPSWGKDCWAGKDWFIGFRKRQHLSLPTTEATSAARASALNQHSVRKSFDNQAKVMDQYHFKPEDMDETGLQTVQTPGRDLASVCSRQVGGITSARRGELITFACTVNAVGNALPPIFIFPRMRYKEHFIHDAPTGSVGCAFGSGWINEKIFCEVYLPHLIQRTRCSQKNKILLILDNHVPHVSIYALNETKKNGIVVLSITPHTSHKLQPCVHIWADAIAFRGVITQSNITAGFQKSVIFPYNKGVFQPHDFAAATVSDRPLPPSQKKSTASELSSSSSNDTPSTSKHVSPAVIAPMPKSLPRKQNINRKRKKSMILEDTPV